MPLQRWRADWRLVDDWGWSALHEACAAGHTDTIQLLVRECGDLW